METALPDGVASFSRIMPQSRVQERFELLTWPLNSSDVNPIEDQQLQSMEAMESITPSVRAYVVAKGGKTQY